MASGLVGHFRFMGARWARSVEHDWVLWEVLPVIVEGNWADTHCI